MVTRTLRAYVELAAGLGEVTRARAVEAAQEIVAFAGSDPSPKQVAAQVTRLADDLLKAAEHNRDQVVALVQREVESALARVDAGRVLGEVQSLGTTVAGLASQVDDIARAVGMRAARPPLPGRADIAEPALATPPALDVTAPAPRRTADATTTSSARKAPARKAPARKASAKKASAKQTSAEKAPAKRTSTKQASTKQASAKKASTKQASAKKAPAKKASTKKASTKKAPPMKASGA